MILVKRPILSAGDSSDILTSVICSVGVLFCMVTVVLGIKFKWFKHRLNFQNTPSGSEKRDTGAGVSQKGETVPLQGVFRRKVDADSFVDNERPKTLPPVRIRKADLQIPVPSRLSLAGNSVPSIDEKNTAEPPMPPPMPTSGKRNENRSQKGKRSRSSSRPRSEQNTKFDDSPTVIKSGSSRKQKPQDSKQKPQDSKQSPAPQYSEVQKNKRQDQDKRSRAPSGSRENKTKARNVHEQTDQTRHFEKLKDDNPSAKSDYNSRIAERRPTGYIRPKNDEMEALAELSNYDKKNTLKFDDFANSDSNLELFEKVKIKPVPEPRKRVSNEFTPPPVASVASKSNDSWSAVARHRILTEELTKQHSALKPVMMDTKKTAATEFQNPLTDSKPRTMRDMKKNQGFAQNERVVLGQEQHDDTEA